MQRSLSLLAFLALPASAPSGRAQTPCGSWTPGFAAATAPMSELRDLQSYDDGPGALLFAAGRDLAATGTGSVMSWDGQRWSDSLLVPGVPGFELPIFELLSGCSDANGPCLVAVARTTLSPARFTVWRLQNGAWTQLGGVQTGNCSAVTSFDAGSGLELFLAQYTQSGVVAVAQVQRWSGGAWTNFGPTLPDVPFDLAVHDDGAGAELYLAGRPALSPTSSIVRWTGSSWAGVGTLATPANALEVYDSGAGARLHATTATIPGTLQRWNSSTWEFVGQSTTGARRTGVADLGQGPTLFLNPTWTSWNGTAIASWSPPNELGQGDVAPHAGAIYDHSRQLNASTGRLMFGVSLFDGNTWRAIGEGFDARVRALATFDAGAGRELYAAGDFGLAGSLGLCDRIARWNGSGWSELGAGLFEEALALAAVDVGAGEKLYVAGTFFPTGGPPISAFPHSGVAAWNGSAWETLAGGLHGEGHALVGFDDGGGTRLVAGGNFTVAGGGPGDRIAQWNGTSWSALGAGTNGVVSALATFDEGGGTRLFAAGTFTSAGGAAAQRIARWNGSAWSALGAGLNDAALALCVFDDGGGAQLYAGGTFTDAGGVGVQHLARWNGTSWSDLPGGGTNGAVLALSVHDDGRGPALYVGGGFSTAGGVTAYQLARFDGAAWEAVDGGLDNVVRALASIDDDGDGDAELFVGGDFANTASFGTGRIARLAGCPHYNSFCFGDGTLADHTTPCPCANDGAAGHGCANPFEADGALLSAAGGVQPDTLVLAGSGMPLSAFGIYLQHDASDDRVFHDGVICAGGNLIRLRNRNAVGGVSSYPNSTDTQTISQRGQVTPGSGATRYYSLFYRSASPTFCPPATANVTNGIRVIW